MLQVLLLDEITVDLDVLGRADLMSFLRQECRERGATIIYVRGCGAGLASPSPPACLARCPAPAGMPACMHACAPIAACSLGAAEVGGCRLGQPGFGPGTALGAVRGGGDSRRRALPQEGQFGSHCGGKCRDVTGAPLGTITLLGSPKRA